MPIFHTRLVPLSKAGQIYTGPKGGKWANPEHTIEYREGGAQRQPGQKIAKRGKPRKRPKSVIHKLAAHLVFHAMKLVQHAMRGALDVARGAIEGASEAMKPDAAEGGQFEQDVAPDKGDGSPQAAPAVPQLPPNVAKTIDDETLAAATEQLTEMHASAPVEHKPAIEMTYKMLCQAHAEKQRAAKAAKLAAQHAAAGGDPFEAPGVGHPGAVHLPIPKKPVQSASDKATDAAKFKQAKQQRAQAKKQPKQAAKQKPVATKKPSKKPTSRSAKAVKRPPAKKPTKRSSVRKSLVIKALKLHKRIKFRGLDLSIENAKGTHRRWYDPHAKQEGFTTMRNDYGYVRNTLGTDGDHVDVYVGPDEQASHVYVVTQLKAPDFLETDEQKCMLGFASAHDAQEAYLAHYDDPRFLGDIREVPFEDFARYVTNKDNHGELIRSNVRKMSLHKSGYYSHGVNIDSQGSSAGERVLPQPVPDMRTWQQPKTAESKVRERDANRRRRRAFARWSRGALSLYGEPPDRKLRYRHQYLTTFKDRKAMLATRTPQIVADPITDRDTSVIRKAQRGDQVSGHKYTRRMPDGKGGWQYEYATVSREHARVGLGSAVRNGRGEVGHVINDSVRFHQQMGEHEVEASEPHLAVQYHRNGKVRTEVLPPHALQPHNGEAEMHEQTRALIEKKHASREQQFAKERAKHKASYAESAQDSMARKRDRAAVKELGGSAHVSDSKPVKSLKMITSLAGVSEATATEREHAGQAERRVWTADGKLLGLPDDTKNANQVDGEYTAARKQLHEQIIGSFTKHVKTVPKDEKPLAIVTMGGSGAGKGSILKALVGDHNDFVVADPDACKEKLPEYQKAVHYGTNKDGAVVSSLTAAAMAHEESSDLGDQVRQRAMSERKNLILDGTGKNTAKFTKRIEELKAAGYHVRLVMPHIPISTAVERAHSRANGSGRYVPDDFVTEAHHVIPGNFETIARHAHEFALFDNRNGPRMVWSGGQGEADVVHDEDFVKAFKRTGQRRHAIARTKGWMAKSFRRFMIRRGLV